MVVEKDILGEKTLAKLAEYIRKDLDSWMRWRNDLVHGYAPKYQDLSGSVKALRAWREKDDITDEQLRAFLILFIAHLVENEVEGRFERVFEERFRSLVSPIGR